MRRKGGSEGDLVSWNADVMADVAGRRCKMVMKLTMNMTAWWRM
jgi:hypothetical protein